MTVMRLLIETMILYLDYWSIEACSGKKATRYFIGSEPSGHLACARVLGGAAELEQKRKMCQEFFVSR